MRKPKNNAQEESFVLNADKVTQNHSITPHKKISLDIPSEIYRSLKLACLNKDTTIKKLVNQAIEKYLMENQ